MPLPLLPSRSNVPAAAALCASRRRGCPGQAALQRGSRAALWSRCRGLPDADRVLYTDEVPLTQLQQRLEQAIDDEDYEAAAQLRDVIQ
jgi:hypothetical protein